jgi:MFS family permease
LYSQKKTIFYGWKVVNALFWINATLVGPFCVFGIFFKPLEAYFNVSRATTSSIISVYTAITAGVGVLGGWALDRFGPRRVILTMSFLTGASLLLTSQVHVLWLFFITYSLLMALGNGALYIASMPIIMRWFERKRGIASGIAMAGIGIGQVILAPVATFFIVRFDWHASFLALGLIAWFVAMPLSLVLKREPMEIGLFPDGRQSDVEAKHDTRATDAPVIFSTRSVLKTMNFWLITSLQFLLGICLSMVTTHIVPHVMDIGFSAEQGATVVSIIGIMSIIGNLFWGVVNDRIGAKSTVIVCALGMAAVIAWLTHVSIVWQIYLVAILYGLTSGGIVSAQATLFGRTFGITHIGKIMGMLNISWAIGAAGGPIIGGMLFDVVGNYKMAFWIAAIAMVIAAVMVVLVRRQAAGLPESN